MTWQPGTRLNQYKIERVLGSGGFGITYKATHLALNQRVVIKTINDTLHGDPEYQGYVERFRKEAQILAKLGELRHPLPHRISGSVAWQSETQCEHCLDFQGKFQSG
jgi:serine/threonine-protein kinase